MTRQARLFAIVEYLRARKTGVTAQMLADRFEVTIRTIYRDLDALRDAHLPLRAEQGRGGGYALDRHYSLPPINLSAREAALFVVSTHGMPGSAVAEPGLRTTIGRRAGTAERTRRPNPESRIPSPVVQGSPRAPF